MVKVSDVRMSFGSHVIFDELKFNINRGERIGLIGRNGSGKTTLFNLIIGTLKPDGGTISIPKGYRIGGLSQQLTFLKHTVLAEGCTALHGERAEDIWWVEKVLAGLGFTERDLDKHPEELSGGFQVRLNLAKALIKEPNLLLLDEPNNFLDILAIRWLIRFLRSWGGEFMLITHDRGFMDSVVTHTMIIHRGKIRKLAGGTEKLYKQILKEEEVYEKTRLNVEKRQKEAELFINRFRAKARLAGLVQSRIKTLQKQETKQKLEKLKTIDFSFHTAPSPSKYLMNVKNISFSYGQQYPHLIKDLSVTITREDRIGVIGKNGKGKSTLLRLLAGELVPLQGRITSHPGLSIGHFGQTNVERLNEHLTIEQELLSSDPEYSRKRVMDVCGSMLVGGELSQKKIAVLSGGERSRVLLGKLLLEPANLLLLDEPTNHLDMESCDSLMAAIDTFQGAVLIVTHNETFLHTLVRRLIVFDHDEVFLFSGSYADFLGKTGWEAEGLQTTQTDLRSSAQRFSAQRFSAQRFSAQVHPSRSDLRRRRAELINERSRFLRMVHENIIEIEEKIQSTEEQLEKNNKMMIHASERGSGEDIQMLSKENHSLKNRLSDLYEQLEDALREKEQREAVFDRMLEELSKN